MEIAQLLISNPNVFFYARELKEELPEMNELAFGREFSDIIANPQFNHFKGTQGYVVYYPQAHAMTHLDDHGINPYIVAYCMEMNLPISCEKFQGYKYVLWMKQKRTLFYQQMNGKIANHSDDEQNQFKCWLANIVLNEK